jgi:hypothetical protein
MLCYLGSAVQQDDEDEYQEILLPKVSEGSVLIIDILWFIGVDL